jgi:hypothetical protein
MGSSPEVPAGSPPEFVPHLSTNLSFADHLGQPYSIVGQPVLSVGAGSAALLLEAW